MTCIIEPAINVYSREEYLRRISSLNSRAQIIQLDVIDGIFARPKNYNDPKVVGEILLRNKIDVHLMVMDIEKELKAWLPIKPYRIIIHVEHPDQIERHFRTLEKNNIKKGLAIAPFTSLKKIAPFVEEIDYLLLLSVVPGGNGQKFISTTIDRLRIVRSKYPALEIGIDGGIGEDYLTILKNAGVNDIVIGSSLFNGDEQKRYQAFNDIVGTH